MIGVSVGVAPFVPSNGAVVALLYTERVTADGGYYEGVVCLINAINQL